MLGWGPESQYDTRGVVFLNEGFDKVTIRGPKKQTGAGKPDKKILELLVTKGIKCHPGKGYNSVHWLPWMFQGLNVKVRQDNTEWEILCDMGGLGWNSLRRPRCQTWQHAWKRSRACFSVCIFLCISSLEDIQTYICHPTTCMYICL